MGAAPADRFTRVSVEQGLSQSTVQAVLQDHDGFVWLGTEEGLNRYDGYSFVAFRHDPRNRGSLPQDGVTALHEDRQQRLWVGTESGAAIFDRGSQTFEAVPSVQGRVSEILEDPDGRLWVGTEGQGLFERDPATGTFFQHVHNPEDSASIASNVVSSLLRDRSGRLWVGTKGGGLDVRDEQRGVFEHRRHDARDPRSLAHDEVWDVAEDKTGNLWVATYGAGLSVLDPATGIFRHLDGATGRSHDLGSDLMTCVVVDGSGTVWIGTDGGGALKYVAATDSFVSIRNNAADPASLSQDVIREIYEDRQGHLWFGTYLGGVNLLRSPRRAFEYYTRTTASSQSPSDPSITSLLEDTDGRVWLGMKGGWLNRFERETGTFVPYRVPSSAPGGSAVVSLYQDRHGSIWAGTYRGGLARFDPDRGSFDTFVNRPGDPSSLRNDEVWAIAEDEDGALWIGTNAGLDRFDPGRGIVTSHVVTYAPAGLSPAGVRSLLRSRRGDLWIGGFGGLSLMRRGSSDLVRYWHDDANPNSLSSNGVIVLYEDHEGRLWIGTYGGGLNRFDPDTETFTVFPGLPSNVIYGIEEDAEGRLWVSTNYGLSRLDPATGGVENFDLSSGLQSLQFHLGSSLRTRDGRLLFGSIDGFYDFDPRAVEPSTFVPPVVLTALRVFDENVELSTALSGLGAIELAYDDAFSLEFAALDFVFPKRNRYAYMLEGLSDEWIPLEGRRDVTFTNLDPGRYVFRVKASNSDGVWDATASTAIEVIVRPPIWMTWWFRGLVAVLLGLGLVAAHRLRVRRVTEGLAERMRVAEELRRAAEEVSELYNHAPCGYHSVDERGVILRINDTELEWLGYTREEVVGKMNIADVVTPESMSTFAGRIAQLKETGRLRDVEGEMLRKDGTRLPVLVNTTAVRDREGNFVMTNSTLFDVTERRLLEEQLRQSQKMEAVGRLAGGVAHDFNNLLTAILGYSTLALRRVTSDDRLRDQIEQIRQASQRAASLTKQLLAFSRKQVLQPRVLDLNTVVADMDKMLMRLIGEDVRLTTVLEPSLGRIKADPNQLEQVILNLAVNARDAMPEGGNLTLETANVELGEAFARSHVAVRPGPFVMLAVSDTGHGIDDETRRHIFEPFFTTKASGKGTGMGLSTVYGIVKQSGGSIWVYSEPEKGTSFRIYLPRIDGELDAPEARVAGGEVPKGSETLLLVEDEDIVRELAVDVLKTAGYKVLSAAHGKEALELSARFDGAIQLMITDVVMPKMGGRELASHLATLRPAMKVIYVSGYTENAIVHHGILDPDTTFLQKPFAPDALLRTVRRVLDGDR